MDLLLELSIADSGHELEAPHLSQRCSSPHFSNGGLILVGWQ
jgi:hypothetical protein